MKKPKQKDQSENIIPELQRRDFLKKSGILAGGSFGLANLPGSRGQKNSDEKQEVYYCHMLGENLENERSYWETLLFRCYQGIVNRGAAKMYINVYQKGVFLDWYKSYDHLQFKRFENPYHLSDALGWDKIQGYVIVDPSAPDSINVAANFSSLDNLVPVTEDLLKGNKLPDLEVVDDLRDTYRGIKFANLSRLEVYQWVYENQWPRSNHNLISIISGAQYKNGHLETGFYTSNNSRDYAVAERALFFDLSSNPAHNEELALKDKILSEMDPHSIVWGWHVDRDSEHQHIGQMSKHGKIAVGGANVVPNFSFHSRIKTEGVKNFRERNSKLKVDDSLEDKIYLAFVLSDGDSLNHLLRNAHGGQWLAKERGKIPYNWEMQLKLADIGPGILDYFQATATSNDFFVASASGIGYTFPTYMPENKLRSLLYATKPYLRKTGMKSMVVLNSYYKLSKEKMEVYNEALSEDITGIVQGYTRPPGVEYLYGDAGGESSAADYMAWLSTALPIAHTDTTKDMEDYLVQLAKRRTQRPLFVPIHLPRSYFRYPEIVQLMQRLDPDLFEALDYDSFMAKFAKARTNKLGLNLPEYFMPEPISLKNGGLNKVFVRLQNFNENKKEARVRLKLYCDAWDDPLTTGKNADVEGKGEAEMGLTLSLRKRSGSGNGQLEYLVNEESVMKIPVTFMESN